MGKDALRFHPLVRAAKEREDEGENSPLLPVQKLLMAMIGRAVMDCKRQEVELRIDARDWLIEEPKRNFEAPYRPWSYNWVCDHLKLENWLRKRIAMKCCDGKKRDFRVNLVDFY